MNNRQSDIERDSECWSRRDLLKGLGAAALTTLALDEPRPTRAAEAAQHPRPTADTCILLWMAGGMAAPETFDLGNLNVPFEVNVPARSAFIYTFRVFHRQSEQHPHLARVWKTHCPRHGADTHADSFAPRCGPGQHSAFAASVSLAYRIRPAANRRLPPYRLVDCPRAPRQQPRHPPIHQHRTRRLEGVGESEELKAFTTGGFFGSEFGPFNIPFPQDAVDAVRPPRGADALRTLRGHAGKHYREARAVPWANWRAITITNPCCARLRTPTAC